MEAWGRKLLLGLVANLEAMPYMTSQRVTVRAQADIFISSSMSTCGKTPHQKEDRGSLGTNEMNIALL